ncbi:uncharacterized protein LOC112456853 [Temnothorax curvispinosus]|uniref:Uncharacterized protein LOC112456853 n=1 Tax=Temnothorax curvispinosus TaxID=300111 RepID=A0A6J1Q1M7_9HYME|nr:uncharacterized protein LOC112456853 [Temnothorax curvispinosus]
MPMCSDEETALKWMQAANKNKVNLKNARICSVHFTPSCYKPKPAYLANCENYSPKKLRRLHDHAIPTENLPLLKKKEVLKEVQNQHNIINVSENSSKNSFSESETNLIDTSMENKAETCFMQSSKENARYNFIDFMRINDFIAVQEIIACCFIFLFLKYFLLSAVQVMIQCDILPEKRNTEKDEDFTLIDFNDRTDAMMAYALESTEGEQQVELVEVDEEAAYFNAELNEFDFIDQGLDDTDDFPQDQQRIIEVEDIIEREAVTYIMLTESSELAAASINHHWIKTTNIKRFYLATHGSQPYSSLTPTCAPCMEELS